MMRGTGSVATAVGDWRVALAAVVVILSSNLQTWGQDYSIDAHTIDGGGGTSTGGVYSVTGTIGQPDAGTAMSGGNYTMQGGFWSLIAVQTPGGPRLTIVPAGPGMAHISWSPETPGFVLQEKLSLSPLVNWINSASGTNNPADVTVPGQTTFYRLLKP